MFTIISPDLSASRTSSNRGAPLATIDGTGGGGLLVTTQAPDRLLSTSGTIEIPAYSDGLLTVTIPDDVGVIGTVTIGNVTYTPESFSQDGDELTIALEDGNEPAPGTLLRYTGLAAQYDGVYPDGSLTGFVPSFFEEWNLEGEVTIERSLEDHPTATLSFSALATAEPSIRALLRGNVEISLFGIGFRTASRAQITRPLDAENNGRIDVTLQLEGKWLLPLSTKVKLSDAESVSSANPDQCSKNKTSVGDLLSVAGIPYSGPSITIPVPRDTDPNASTEPGSEISSRARVTGSYAFYSSPNSVQLRTWGASRLHILSRADVKSQIQIDCTGQGADLAGVQLANEFKNVELQLEDDADTSDYEEDVYLTLIDGDRFPTSPPDVARGSFRDIALAFDNGGPVRTRRIEQRLNGKTLSIEEVKWGFQYALTDCYTLNTSTAGSQTTYTWRYNTGLDLFGPTQFWGVFERTRTEYNYDADGYLISITTTGFSKQRYENDSDKTSLQIKAWIEAGDNLNGLNFIGEDVEDISGRLAELLSLRTNFETLPLFDRTDYELKSMVDVYPDITRPDDATDWVEPKYCSRMTRTCTNTISRNNPQSTKSNPLPDISIGKSYQEQEAIDIVYPQGLGTSIYQQSKDRYKKYTFPQNAEGKLALGLETFEESDGRPQIHERLERSQPSCAPLPAPAPATTKRILLNTPGSGVSARDPEYGSISFPNVGDRNRALRAANTEASIANTVNSETWTITVEPTTRYEEGDRVWFDGHLFVILSVSEPRVIERGALRSDGWVLTMGRKVDISLGVTEVG